MSTTINPETAAVETTKPRRKWVSKLADYPVPEGTKLTTTPPDFDHEKFKPIPPKHWVDRPANLEHRAEIYERKGAKLRETAQFEREAGPALKAQKKFLAAQAMMEKLAKELTAAGVDVNELKAKAAAS